MAGAGLGSVLAGSGVRTFGGVAAAGAVSRETCVWSVIWCCWRTTRTVSPPTATVAITRKVSKILFERAQCMFIKAPTARCPGITLILRNQNQTRMSEILRQL
jgi:hypothetical protein